MKPIRTFLPPVYGTGIKKAAFEKLLPARIRFDPGGDVKPTGYRSKNRQDTGGQKYLVLPANGGGPGSGHVGAALSPGSSFT